MMAIQKFLHVLYENGQVEFKAGQKGLPASMGKISKQRQLN
jgi:hypothetical protein